MRGIGVYQTANPRLGRHDEYGMRLMQACSLLRIGIIGTAVAAVCCFTPLLVVLLGIVGLSAFTGWLDYVLLPVLAIFVSITLYAMIKVRSR